MNKLVTVRDVMSISVDPSRYVIVVTYIIHYELYLIEKLVE